MTASPVPLRNRLLASLLPALAVAAITQLGTTLVFFVGSDFASEQLVVINGFFIAPSCLLFVFLSVAGLLGAYRRWYLLLVSAVLSAVLAAFLGTVITYLAAGNPYDAQVLPSAWATLPSNHLIFVVAAIVATVTAGRSIQASLPARPPAARQHRRMALVREPASTLADGQLTHLERSDIDLDLARRQWDSYVDVIEAEGFQTLAVQSADALPDSVFIEDTVVMLDRLAVITSPGAESRRAETTAVELAVKNLGLRLRQIELPGTLDGGDVLKVGRTVYIGRGGRTNAEGIRQFRAIASATGFRVVAVPVSRVLHLKSAVTALPDGTVIGHAPLVEHPELFDRFLAVPEESGAAVVVLSDDAVLMAASAPLTAAMLEDLGFRVVTVDISEFEKLEGCVTCLSVRIR